MTRMLIVCEQTARLLSQQEINLITANILLIIC